jgi:hypothetical protein
LINFSDNLEVNQIESLFEEQEVDFYISLGSEYSRTKRESTIYITEPPLEIYTVFGRFEDNEAGSPAPGYGIINIEGADCLWT